MILAKTFGILCAICLIVYVVMLAIVMTNPLIAMGITPIMILSGWGAGAFFILAIVMFVLHK